jgi:uncharacterized membrane protein YhaH (DUF805 family)
MIKLFFSPAGRMSRSQYWLVHTAVIPILALAIIPMFSANKGDYVGAIMQSLGYLALILPFTMWFGFCATVKRYHDRGKSGWWYLMVFVPYIGGIWHFIECGCLPGDSSSNEYGPPNGHVTTSEDDDYLLQGDVNDRYQKAIENALSSQNAPAAAAVSPSHPKPAQQYFDRPRNGQPVFGKRI